MTIIKTTCLILALVSSQGDVINVNHLRYLKNALDGGCNIYQTYNPYKIHSDWACDEVEKSIIDAMKRGCDKC